MEVIPIIAQIIICIKSLIFGLTFNKSSKKLTTVIKNQNHQSKNNLEISSGFSHNKLLKIEK
jgi:hypothetical protein